MEPAWARVGGFGTADPLPHHSPAVRVASARREGCAPALRLRRRSRRLSLPGATRLRPSTPF